MQNQDSLRQDKAGNAFTMLNNMGKLSQYSTDQDRAETAPELRAFHPNSMAQNAGGWLEVISKNYPPSTPRTLEESCEYSGSIPTSTNISSPAATTTIWAPSSWECDGDRWDMWWEESQATSLAQPFTGQNRVSKNEGYPRTPGVEL